MAEALPIPPVALTDPDSLEIARIWVAKGGQHSSLSPTTWEDPALWGQFLVEFISHVADSYERRGKDRDEVLARIRAGFEKEWDMLIDQPRSEFIDK